MNTLIRIGLAYDILGALMVEMFLIWKFIKQFRSETPFAATTKTWCGLGLVPETRSTSSFDLVISVPVSSLVSFARGCNSFPASLSEEHPFLNGMMLTWFGVMVTRMHSYSRIVVHGLATDAGVRFHSASMIYAYLVHLQSHSKVWPYDTYYGDSLYALYSLRKAARPE